MVNARDNLDPEAPVTGPLHSLPVRMSSLDRSHLCVFFAKKGQHWNLCLFDDFNGISVVITVETIRHLKLSFQAEQPPPSQTAQQELLIEAEESAEPLTLSFSV